MVHDDPYADLAGDYVFVEADAHLEGDMFVARYGDVLAGLPDGAQVLDCACGTGSDALAVARLGYAAHGCDASEGMVEVARRRAEEEGLDVPFEAEVWDGLPARFGPDRFDAVFCLGNAIAHAEDEEAMVRSLACMAEILRPGGRIVVDSRDWEGLEAEDWPVMVNDRTVERNGRRGFVVRAWRPAAGPGGRARMDLVLIVMDGEEISHQVHSLEFSTFTAAQLRERMARAGLEPGERRPSTEPGFYWMEGSRPQR